MLAGVGSTPIIELTGVTSPTAGKVLLKLDWANPTSSMKDRMAASVIGPAAERGDLRPGGTLVDTRGALG